MLLDLLGDTNLSGISHISYYDTALTEFKILLTYQVATDCTAVATAEMVAMI